MYVYLQNDNMKSCFLTRGTCFYVVISEANYYSAKLLTSLFNLLFEIKVKRNHNNSSIKFDSFLGKNQEIPIVTLTP
jgi:hypothetical protein